MHGKGRKVKDRISLKKKDTITYFRVRKKRELNEIDERNAKADIIWYTTTSLKTYLTLLLMQRTLAEHMYIALGGGLHFTSSNMKLNNGITHTQ